MKEDFSAIIIEHRGKYDGRTKGKRSAEINSAQLCKTFESLKFVQSFLAPFYGILVHDLSTQQTLSRAQCATWMPEICKPADLAKPLRSQTDLSSN